ncbi:MAG: RHS repeat-associated core domain-containing protein, partial [Bacteroidota bacterium]
ELEGPAGTDISGWVVTDGQKAGVSDFAIAIPAGTTIPDNGHFVIAHSGSPCAPPVINLDLSTCDCDAEEYYINNIGQSYWSGTTANLTNEGEYLALLDAAGNLVHGISWGNPGKAQNMSSGASGSPITVPDGLGTKQLTIPSPSQAPNQWEETYLSPVNNILEGKSIQQRLDNAGQPDWQIRLQTPTLSPGKDNNTNVGYPFTAIYTSPNGAEGLRYVVGVVSSTCSGGACSAAKTQELVLNLSPDIHYAFDPGIPDAPICTDPGPEVHDQDKNWIKTTTYGTGNQGNSVITGEGIVYFDLLGRPTQVQKKDLQEGKVMASATLYDDFGRGVLETFSAPLDNTCNFEYDDDFILDEATGNPYTFTYFDDYSQSGTSNTREWPRPVNSNSTLGQYYENGSQDSYVAHTNYPYTRQAVTQHGVIRSGGPGHTLRMGGGHEIVMGQFQIQEELNHYIQFRDDLIPGIQEVLSMQDKGAKIVTIDGEGKETVQFYDRYRNLVATCESGDGAPVTRIAHGRDVGGTGAAYYTQVETDDKLHFVDVHVSQDQINTLYWLVGKWKPVKIYNMITDELIYSGKAKDFGAFPYGGFFRIILTDHLNQPIKFKYKLDYHNFTYYYYDRTGQQVSEIQPEGVDITTDNFINAIKLETRETFHGWFSLSVDNPDEGKADFVHRHDGSLRFTQNAEQALTGAYTYLNTDAESGRVFEIGVAHPQAGEPAFEAHLAAGQGLNTVHDIVDDYGALNLPSTRTDQSFTYYDLPDPTLPGLISATPWLAPYADEYRQTFLLGVASKTWNNHSSTWYSYDELGRLRWSIQEIQGLGVFTVDYVYDFQGNLKETLHNKYKPGESSGQRYEYDRDNRLVNAFFKKDQAGAYLRQAQYQYYLHGAVKRLELGPDCMELQGIDYVYNHEGRLKSINQPDGFAAWDPGQDGHTSGDHTGFAQDVFGLTLDYYQNDYAKAGANFISRPGALPGQHHNGLIAAVRWKSQGNPHPLGQQYTYQYQYDERYQLSEAEYGFYQVGGGYTASAYNEYKVWNLSYDRNGNIQTLYRNGIVRTVGQGDTEEMDKLHYHYDAARPNRLNRIEDQAGFGDLGDITNQTTTLNYVYNAIGQVVENHSAPGGGTHLYEYTAYGQVKRVYEDNGTYTSEVAQFIFDEGGYRIKKTLYYPKINQATPQEVQQITWYVRDSDGHVLSIYEQNFQADGTPVQASPSLAEVTIYAGGRLGTYRPDPANTSLQEGVHYEITDHLGNVRVVIRGYKDANGMAIVEDFADYYPFGWELPGQQSMAGYRYTYQGTEQDDGLGWNFFALRTYDPRTARWANPDPYAQYYSPYLAMGNNPISMIDPMGGMSFSFDPWVFIGGLLNKAGNYLMEEYNFYVEVEQKFNPNGAHAYGSTPDVNIVWKKHWMYKVGKELADFGDFMRENGDMFTDLGLDGIQFFLGLIGSSEIPVVSQLADLFDAGISFGRGDKSGALMSLGGILLAGGSQLKLAKTGGKMAKGLDKILDTYQKFRKGKGKKPKKPKTPPKTGCFVAGTKVLTDKGFKNIEDIEAGDKVWIVEESEDGEGFILVEFDWKAEEQKQQEAEAAEQAASEEAATEETQEEERE